ncbi:MAG: hypothetical protein DRR04_04580 [Gammaproteobacteria bacterium]|nr:MAG: hypothetical protein DRQ97_07355 [Gammaproteobacteria bacterium]RLA60865.1 MAG: hypothetical protein DRR04_04580 [Gammaproteobacteria bacterium]
MLEIDPGTLIGRGLHRECFIHPDNHERCIKIIVAGNSNENHREAKYYGLLARRGISWAMLTRFHGLVETNLGEGAIFDLVRDYDGGVSKTLTYYLSSEELTTVNSKPLASALARLRAYLLENRVVTMTLKTKNILFQKTAESDGKLVIVDNVGNSDFIPISNYSTTLARLKIERKWQRFEQSMRTRHTGNKALPTLLD